MNTKVCSRCKEEKGWDDFAPMERDGSGRVVRVAGQCRACKAAYNREYRKKNRERLLAQRRANEAFKRRDPKYRERLSEYHRQWTERKRDDPEWLERKRARDREYHRTVTRERYRTDDEFRGLVTARQRDGYARRHGRKRPSPYEREVRMNHKADLLPIEPFREWLRWYLDQEREPDADSGKELAVAYRRIAWATGGNEASANRQVYRWLNESKHIPLDLADAVLTRLDSPARLYELWPDLAEDVAA